MFLVFICCRFASESFASLIEGDRSTVNNDQAEKLDESIVVFASKSGREVTNEVEKEYRSALLMVVCIQTSLVMYYAAFSGILSSLVYLCVFGMNVLALVGVRYSSPNLLVLVCLLEIWFVLESFYLSTTPLFVYLLSMCMIFLVNGIKNIHMSQTFLIKPLVS